MKLNNIRYNKTRYCVPAGALMLCMGMFVYAPNVLAQTDEPDVVLKKSDTPKQRQYTLRAVEGRVTDADGNPCLVQWLRP